MSPAASRAFAVEDVINEAEPNVATLVPEPLKVPMTEAVPEAFLYVTTDADEPVVVPEVAEEVVPFTKYAEMISPAAGATNTGIYPELPSVATEPNVALLCPIGIRSALKPISVSYAGPVAAEAVAPSLYPYW